MPPKASRKQLNDEISLLVVKKLLNKERWTQEEIAFAQLYTGDGGLKGAQSRGILYEYYTPYEIVSRMWTLAKEAGFKTGNILEPSCGIGRFLHYVDPSTNNVDAFEWSKDNDTSFQIARATYPWANIDNSPFESIFYQGNVRTGRTEQYDLVIGNPPYGEFTGFYASKAYEGSIAKRVGIRTYDQYFLWAGIELLKPGGVLVYIIPSTFLDGDYRDFKETIYSNASLLAAYRMPRGLFDATDIQTDIVVFKKLGN